MISVHLGLSYRCNMNCSHCYVKEKEKAGKVIPPEKHDELLQKLKRLGSFSITYTMGESLLDPNFFVFAQKAKEAQLYQILLSNGSLLETASDVQKLIDHGIKKVGISLDSSKRSAHDNNRHYEGAFDKALHAIALLADRPEIDMRILSTISETNCKEIYQILELGHSLNVTDYSFLWLRKAGSLAPVSDQATYQKAMTDLIMEHASGRSRIALHDHRVNPIAKRLFEDGTINESVYREILDMNHCHASEEMVMISPSGDMFSCNFSQRPFANIFSDDMATIKQQAMMQKASCIKKWKKDDG